MPLISADMHRGLCIYNHSVIFYRNPIGSCLFMWPLTSSCVRPTEMLVPAKCQLFSFKRKGKYVVWDKENEVNFFEKPSEERFVSSGRRKCQTVFSYQKLSFSFFSLFLIHANSPITFRVRSGLTKQKEAKAFHSMSKQKQRKKHLSANSRVSERLPPVE